MVQTTENQPAAASVPAGVKPKSTIVKIVFLVLSIFVVFLIVFFATFFILGKNAGASVSGVISYTALKPDPGDRGQVQIKYRKYGDMGPYTIAYTVSTLADKSPWAWRDAASGQPYELAADLLVDGKLVTTSDNLIVTAPAMNQNLNLHVTWHDLPQTVVSEQTTYIKGTIRVNGLIPPASKILIQAKTAEDSDYQTVQTISDVSSVNDWKWDKTVPLKDYTVHAVLTDGQTEYAKSETLTAAGGDVAINFTLNSVAPMPTVAISPSSIPEVVVIVPTSTQQNLSQTPTPIPPNTVGNISGTIFINGPEDVNTSVIILWRNPGDKDYQFINRINNPSHNGQAWSWNNVSAGKQYEMIAYLQVKEKNTASAQSQIVTAPAQNVNFTLNTGVFIPTPNGTVSVNFCNNLGNNLYNATVSFPRQPTTGNYWIQIGNNVTGADIYNSKIQSNTLNNPQITVQTIGNNTYFARYAYSLCTNCDEDANFSNFSATSTFSCSGSRPVTGYYCNNSYYSCQQTTDNNPPYPFSNEGLSRCQQYCHPTPTLAPSPIPTATPTPTPSPKIAYCNETCGSNGYLCDYGLVCTSQSPGALGSSVCRNPDCTDEPTCTCLSR